VREHLAATERAADLTAAPEAVGAAVFVHGALSGVDVFTAPTLFARQWRKLLRAHAVGAYATAPSPTASEPKLRATLQALLTAAGSTVGTLRGNAGVGQVFEFAVERHRGAALAYEKTLVHAAIL
jgi:hypothetical protein